VHAERCGDVRKCDVDAHERWLVNVAQIIHQRTEGNPMFIVDLVDHLVAQGLMDLGRDSSRVAELLEDSGNLVPRTIRQITERNLERLGADEQRTLEAASIAGAEFSAAAVAAALELPVAEIETCCLRLSRHEQFIEACDDSEWPDGMLAASFRFQHALYQEVLYGRVPPGQRAEFHRRIAARQEAAYGEQVAEIAAELAHHYRHGNEKAKAIEYLGRAAQQALQRAAYADAISNFSSALELVQRQPDDAHRAQQELSLQLGLGSALAAAKGFSAPEAERAYTRAEQLCERLADAAQLFDALYGLLVVHVLAARHAAAFKLAERLQRVAEAANDSGRLLLAHLALGNFFFGIGDFLSARPHCEMAISLYDPECPRQLNPHGGDVRVNPRSNLGRILWSFGYPDRALQLGNEARAIAQSSSSRHSQAFAEAYVTYLHSERREARATQESAEHLIALSTENGLPLWLARGITLRGWAIALQGRYEEGIALIREGSAATRATGTEFTRLPDLLLLADACLEAGRLSEGLDALTEARTLVRSAHRFSAMIEVSKGKLLSRLPGSKAAEAENCFRSAIEIARKLNEKMTELQAATGLARLLASRGDRDEAYAMLCDIYNWFTEGFDTADLIEAKILLEELDQNRAVAADLNGRPPRGGLHRIRIQ